MRQSRAALAAVLVSLSLPGSAAAETIEFDLGPGIDSSSQHTVTMLERTTYTITVSGTLTVQFGNNQTCVFDFAYSGSKGGSCSSGDMASHPDGSGIGSSAPPFTGRGQALSQLPSSYPAFRSDHVYTFTFTSTQTHDRVFWTRPYGEGRQETWSGGFHVKIVGPDPEEGCPAPRGRVAQDSCPAPGPTVSGLKGKVEIQRGGAGWVPLKEGETLLEGDRIHTGWKSGVTLRLPNGGTVTLEPMSLVAIDRTTPGGGGRILLRLGEVKAKIRIPDRTPGPDSVWVFGGITTTASIRGTAFSMRYDGRLTVVSVTEGIVSVKPKAGRAVDVTAGQEVASTRTRVSRPVAIGRAGAPRGSVGPARAAALLTKALAKGFAACRVDVARTGDAFKLKAIKRGWRATLKIVGAHKGRAVWTIKGKKRVMPRNALAKRISRRCS